MKLLLAEDDDSIGSATSKYFFGLGHTVDWVRDGNQLLLLAQRLDIDCILLDLGLRELSGSDCLVNLRVRNDSTPVIVITSQTARDTRMRLLELGADDYMVKPFDLGELAARAAAVVRRNRTRSTLNDDERVFGPFTLVPGSMSVLDGGRPIALTAKEYAVLETLVRNRNRIVTRQQLEAAIHGWNHRAGSNAIEVHVHNLRRKLSPGLIATVRGLGYQIDLS